MVHVTLAVVLPFSSPSDSLTYRRPNPSNKGELTLPYSVPFLPLLVDAVRRTALLRPRSVVTCSLAVRA